MLLLASRGQANLQERHAHKSFKVDVPSLEVCLVFCQVSFLARGHYNFEFQNSNFSMYKPSWSHNFPTSTSQMLVLFYLALLLSYYIIYVLLVCIYGCVCVYMHIYTYLDIHINESAK